jgi:hypothetical protein
LVRAACNLLPISEPKGLRVAFSRVYGFAPSLRLGAGFAALLAGAVLSLTPRSAHALGAQGDFLQTDTLGASIWSHDYEKKTSTNIGKNFNLSEFVGLHYYVVDTLRVGMNLQFTERVFAHPHSKTSEFQRFGLLPQVGWNFYGPLFSALVFGIVPRTGGKDQLNLTVQGVLGVSLPLAGPVRLSLAGEVPWTYYDHKAIGLTALTGISIRL